jgi:glucokinase
MYLAIDVGGTSINMGLFEKLDPKSKVAGVLLKVKNNFAADMVQIKDAIDKLTTSKIESVGICTPGLLTKDETQIIIAENLSGWQKKDIPLELKGLLGAKFAFLCHDVKAAAISECVFGGMDTDFAFIIWGTGIGCGYARYYNSKRIEFQQVEIGYQVIAKTIKLDGEEFPGYLEYHCGGRKIEKRFGKPAAEISDKEWNIVLDDMSSGLRNLLQLNYPPTVIFGGGVILKQTKRLKQLQKLVAGKIRYERESQFKIATFGEEAGLIGALGLIKLKLKNPAVR